MPFIEFDDLDPGSIGVTDTLPGLLDDRYNALKDVLNESVGILFQQDDDTTSGLTFGYTAGRVRNASGTIVQVAAGTLALSASATNYIEVNAAGTVSKNTTSFTLGSKPIYTAATGAGSITTLTDCRVDFNFYGIAIGPMTYQGTWNASTNSPALASGTGTTGYVYRVSVAGATNLDGITDWKLGDFAVFNGTTWDKWDSTDAVTSVTGGSGISVTGTGALTVAIDSTVATLTGSQTLTNKSIAGSQLTGAVTAAGLTQATSRILGRTSASTGAIEEISIGGGLLLSGGTLSFNGTGDAITKSITQTAHGFSVGNWVYLNGSTYTLTDNATAAQAEMVGVVTTVTDANTFTLTTSGYATGLADHTPSSLSPGSVYFLHSSAGNIGTATSTTNGEVNRAVLVADTTSSGWVIQQPGVVYSDAQYQPLDASLTAYAALITAANKGIYFTGSDTPATFDLTAAARSILDDATVDAIAVTLQVPQLLGGTALTATRLAYAGAGGKLTDNAYFSIDTTATNACGLNSNAVFTDPTTTTQNIRVQSLTNTITANNAQVFSGISINKRLDQNGFNATGSIRGIDGLTYATGASGTVTAIHGLNIFVGNIGTGIVTAATAYLVNTFQNSGGGTLTTAVGFHCPAQTAGTTIYAYRSSVAAASSRWNTYFDGTAQNWFRGNVGIGTSMSVPTAWLHLAAGSTAASSSPLKFTSGSFMTSPEAGAEEFLTDDRTTTITTGAARKRYVLEDATISSGQVMYATTNGRAKGISTFTFDGASLTISAGNIVTDTTTGMTLWTSSSQKGSFWSATPIVQPSGANQAAVGGTASTQTSPYGYTTQAQADGIVTLLNEIRTVLVNVGIMKGSA